MNYKEISEAATPLIAPFASDNDKVICLWDGVTVVRVARCQANWWSLSRDHKASILF
jgi:hypothetical protein